MSDGATIKLGDADTRRLACEIIGMAPDGWVVSVSPPPRTLAQSDKFWTLCGLATKKIRTDQPLDKQDWHDLFLSGWATVSRPDNPPRLVLGLEGERVSLVRHTRWLSKEDMSDLLEYVEAWCTTRGVKVKE